MEPIGRGLNLVCRLSLPNKLKHSVLNNKYQRRKAGLQVTIGHSNNSDD